MYCPRCGREIPEGSRFCMHCGADLRERKERTWWEEPPSLGKVFWDTVEASVKAIIEAKRDAEKEIEKEKMKIAKRKAELGIDEIYRKYGIE